MGPPGTRAVPRTGAIPPVLFRPWIYAFLITALLTVWHRWHFIGLAYFDDALYQMLAKEPGDVRFQRFPFRSLLVAAHALGLSLAPSRAWAILLLGSLKTYLFIGAAAGLLVRELGRVPACLVATVAALMPLWQVEYTVIWPDSWGVMAGILCLYLVYGRASGSPRHRWGGAAWVAIAYLKELLAVPTLLASLGPSRFARAVCRNFALGAGLALVALTAFMSWFRGGFWHPFFLDQYVDFVQQRLSSPSRSWHIAWAVGYLQRHADFWAGYGNTFWAESGTAIALVLALGGILSAVRGRWATPGGRALLVWAAGVWAWMWAATAIPDVWEARYALGPRTGLVLCGAAGWWLLARAEATPGSRFRRWAAWVTMGALVAGIGVNGLRGQSDALRFFTRYGAVERRVVDILDAAPLDVAVVLAVDPTDPERNLTSAILKGDRVRMRLLALSETIPPRRLVRPGETRPDEDVIVISNVRPSIPRPGASLREVFVKGPVAIYRLYVVLPERLGGTSGVERAEPGPGWWR